MLLVPIYPVYAKGIAIMLGSKGNSCLGPTGGLRVCNCKSLRTDGAVPEVGLSNRNRAVSIHWGSCKGLLKGDIDTGLDMDMDIDIDTDSGIAVSITIGWGSLQRHVGLVYRGLGLIQARFTVDPYAN